jgi:hypothetical protein
MNGRIFAFGAAAAVDPKSVEEYHITDGSW